MKKIFYLLLLIVPINGYTQKNKEISVAFMNAATATLFSKFGSLITNIQQPGVELSYGFNWKTKHKYDWYQNVKLSYFYHRFVQHAIPVYTDIGYRYKFSQKWFMQVAVGAGYMHSIPATAQLTLNGSGEYKNGKGIGRMQALGIINIGAAHIFNTSAPKPITVFITYQQMLQMPFIKAYVPLLPYNCVLLGVGIPFKAKK